METETRIDKIKCVARKLLIERFGAEAKIVSVTVSEDTDFDGDDVIVVRVVYETPTGRLDAKKAAGMIRHLRSKLHDDIAEDRFPLLSFVSLVDAKTEAA